MARVNAAEKERHRQALLGSAAAAFAAHGFEGAAIDQISQDAGLAKGTIYNYFPSKRAAFEAVLREACALASAAVGTVPPQATTAQRLEAFVSGNLEWAMRHPALALVMARELLAGAPAERALILEASAACTEKVEEILQRGAEVGELRLPAPAGEMAIAFIALANTLLLQASYGAWPGIGSLPAAVTSLFLSGIDNDRQGS